jgi:hypothetical protein
VLPVLPVLLEQVLLVVQERLRHLEQVLLEQVLPVLPLHLDQDHLLLLLYQFGNLS